MQVMLMRLMSKGEYVIVPKGTKFTGSGKLGLTIVLPRGGVPSRSKTKKESDLSYLGDQSEILCDYFDENKFGVPPYLGLA